MSLDSIQQAARDQFEKHSASYGKSHILANTDDISSALAGIEIAPGCKALDVATGGGHTAIYLAGRGCRVTATAERGLSIDTCLHEAEKFPYPDSSFDLVTCRVAAHHFSDREAFVGEVTRVLKTGGHFLLIDGSIPDGEPDAEEWIHQIEKLRDPSHGRFLSPGAWASLCERHGLQVLRCETTPFKQPDLEWYFQTAGTPPENREKVRALIRNAPNSARKIFHIAEEDGKTVWWWLRLNLVARKQPSELSDS